MYVYIYIYTHIRVCKLLDGWYIGEYYLLYIYAIG